MIKKIFIPGWMHSLDFYKNYTGLDVWLEKEEWGRKPECDCVIGHCAGAVIALEKYAGENIKFIFINPMLPKRRIGQWIWRWSRYLLFSRGIDLSDKKMLHMNFFRGFSKITELARMESMEILQKIPKENVTIIRGEKDKYVFDKKISEAIKNDGYRIIEVKNAGHGWSEIFDEEINKIINK